MSNRLTITLSIVFLLLATLLGLLYFGVIKSPFSNLSASQNPILSLAKGGNKNQNAGNNVIKIKRPVKATYDTAMKDGETYFQAGDFQNAIEEFIRATQLEPSKLDPYQKLGESYTMLADFDRAAENFNYILDHDASNENAKISLAKLNVKKSSFSNALDILLSVNEGNQEARYYIGILRAQQNDMEKAMFNLTKAVELAPTTTIAQKAQNVVNNFQEFNLFNDGKSIHLRTLVARALVQNGDYPVAIGMLKDVLKENKNYRDAWVLLGFSYYLIQKYDLALETLNNAYDLDPEKTETQYFLGLVHTKLENTEKALTYFILALKNGFEPKTDVMRKIADLYITSEKYDDALSSYEELIRDGTVKDINLYVRPMWIYIEIKKEPQKALELAQKAFDLFPETAMAYNLMGWGTLVTDDLEASEKYLSEAIKKDPNLQAAYLNLGDLYKKKNDLEKAKDFYKRSYFIDKNSSIGTSAGAKYNELQGE